MFILTQDEWDKLQKFVTEKKAKIIEITEKIHQKKLISLGIIENFNINNQNINTRRNNIDKKEAIVNQKSIFNFSKRRLTDVETSVLNKGLKFGIKNRKIDTYEIMARFEELAQSLNWLEINPVISNDWTSLFNVNRDKRRPVITRC